MYRSWSEFKVELGVEDSDPTYQRSLSLYRASYDLAHWLYETRKSMGVSQEVFASRLGVSLSQVRRLEAGGGWTPSLDFLVKVSAALGQSFYIAVVDGFVHVRFGLSLEMAG